MVEDIRRAFKDELSEVKWMDDKTKIQAMEKADYMNHFIGYPNWFDNVTFLEEYYQGVRPPFIIILSSLPPTNSHAPLNFSSSSFSRSQLEKIISKIKFHSVNFE